MSRRIEKKGIAKLADCLLNSEYVITDIKEDSTIPIWDGFIELYKKRDHKDKKANRQDRIPVQVKSHMSSDISQEIFMEKVEKSDLENFAKDGGVIFFVIVMKNNVDYRIYFDTLTPLKLKRYINSMGENNSLTISLKTFPENDIGLFTDIFFNFSLDMKKPISDKYLSLNDFMRDKPPGYDFLTLSYRGLRRENQMDYFFDYEGTVYAKHTITGISMQIDTMQLAAYEQTTNIRILIDDEEYYNSPILSRSKDSVKLTLGKSSSFLFQKDEKVILNFSIRGTLYERINDLKFIIAFSRKKHFTLGGDFPHTIISPSESEMLDFTKEIQSNENYLDYLINFSKVLEILNIKDDVNFDDLTEKDKESINILISSFLFNNPQNLSFDDVKEGECFRHNIRISNIRVALMIVKGKDNKYYISNYFMNYLNVTYQSKKTDRKFHVSIYLSLTKEDFETLSNIDYDIIYESFIGLEADFELIGLTNQFILTMINAYDSTKNKIILETAMKILDWVVQIDNLSNSMIYTLNKLQIIKRMRKFLDNEISQLETVIKKCEENDLLTGAYLLLGNKELALYHHNKLSEEKQAEFKKYPIYYFWIE